MASARLGLSRAKTRVERERNTENALRENEPLSLKSSSMHCRSRSDSRTPEHGLVEVKHHNVRLRTKLRTKCVLFPNNSFKVARKLDPKLRIVTQAGVISFATRNNEHPSPHPNN